MSDTLDRVVKDLEDIVGECPVYVPQSGPDTPPDHPQIERWKAWSAQMRLLRQLKGKQQVRDQKARAADEG